MTLAKASTPPLGWNSWDCFGTTVTEDEVIANAEFMAAHMLVHGWDTIVIDADWSDPAARSHGYTEDAELALDEHGRLLPDPARFPSAAGGAGFGPLATRLHKMGLKLGIHVMRGIPKRAVELGTPVLGTDVRAGDVADPTNVCEWNPHYLGLDHSLPEAAAYYRSTAELYAEWGIDFVKADDMLWPYQSADIEAYAAALEGVDREIALSLSPGRDLSAAHLEHLRNHSTMWRICDDVWDRWDDVIPNFARFARWAPFASPDGWPDGDMLPLGRIGIRAERGDPRDDRLSPVERRSLMTLWIIARSPLMIGGDLPSSSPGTIALFTNPDALAILGASRANRELIREDPLVVWGAEGEGVRWVAAFNLGDTPLAVALDTRSLGLGPMPGPVTDIWTGAIVETEAIDVQSDAARSVAPGSTALRLTLDAHGCALLKVDA